MARTVESTREAAGSGALDAIDRKILRVVQEDATLSVTAVGDLVGLSSTPCWKRIRRMERDGYITRKVALVDPNKLGLKVSAFVMLQCEGHSEQALTLLSQRIGELPEILEFYRMAGDIDYMLRVVLPDIGAFEAFRRRLAEAVPLKNLSVRFIDATLGQTTALPIALHRYA